MRRKITRYVWLLMAVALGLTSCNDDDAAHLSAEQQSLLGRAVNFSTSMADDFTTRTTYNASGAFNENDLMVIYRQYSTDNGKTFDANTEGYRVYSYQPQTVGNTGIAINTEWKVTPGKTGKENGETFTQTAADSLTWDNSQTVRFRAWSLSNLSGCLGNGSWDGFYPDFCRADWVTATGPTVNIPLQLKHLGCRIAISPTSGNQISKVEITYDYKDYMYEDNADTDEEDTADKCTEDEAKKRAAAVEAAYNRLCTPGGVDFEYGLKALSQSYKKDGKVSEIETDAAQAQMITYGKKTADELATEAVHPEFHYNNGNQYFIAIPHDISSDTETQGERLSLPYYTRFRVYLRDVNNGDKENTSGYEGGYHIFALNDVVKDGTEEKMFTEDNGGLQFIAGFSYQFTVGYKYGSLQVKMKNNLSWTQQDIEAANLIDQEQTQPTATSYTWWKDAIDDAILKVTKGEVNNYNPEFNISTAAQFIEFIKLVNGTAAKGHTYADYTLERGEEYTDSTAEGLNKHRKWYKVVKGNRTGEITKEDAEEDGFVFYHTYSPADGDNAAHYDEAVLDGPYSFYSTLVNRKFKVNITADIDLQDWPLATIANSTSCPFLGILDGGFHTLSNVYMADGYLFDYAGKALDDMGTNGNGAVISNLVIDSEHPICIVKEGTQVKILGIRLLAPSYKSAFAEKLEGLSYLVGCSNEGDATNGLVGEANNLVMYGCMQTAENISGGALLGKYSDGSKEFFAPQTGTVQWGNFMCNFYDIDHSPNAHAVGSVKDAYLRQQYIRGSKTYMLCAWNDNLVTDREALALLQTQTAFAGFYGLAPWKAMNYAIYQYNQSDMGKLYPCNAQYEKGGTSGYSHRYPVLKSGTPKIETDWNVLDLLN